jgi:hypothetical protein
MPGGQDGGRNNDPRDKPKGNPYPHRGDVKKHIFTQIFKGNDNDGKGGGGGGGDSSNDDGDGYDGN